MGRTLQKVTYQRAKELMKKARNGQRKLTGNTYLFLMPDNLSYGICYHRTTIIVIHPNNRYTLNSGGWRTVTTKQRMNNLAGAHVFQHDWQWFYGDKNTPYSDHCTIDESGKLV